MLDNDRQGGRRGVHGKMFTGAAKVQEGDILTVGMSAVGFSPARLRHLPALQVRNILSKLAVCLLLVSLLTACGGTSEPSEPSDPDAPPAGDLGALQLTVEGLPDGAEANIEVTGPEDYSEVVTGSQTLELRPGSYTVTAETASYQGVSYTGLVEGAVTSEIGVDVVRGETATVGVTYASVGEVDEDEIAAGITRTGVLAEGAFDDYAFEGTENVPLLLDFEGTGDEQGGRYSFSIYREGDLEEPLYESITYVTSNNLSPLYGFTPLETGNYVLRLRGERDTVDYQVAMSYLNGSPEMRAEPTPLSYGETVQGAVTTRSFDSYRFTGTAEESVLLTFSYDRRDSRLQGTYRVEVYREGQTEPLYVSPGYAIFGTPPEVAFTPPEDGDYLIRVVGSDSEGIGSGADVVRYAFGFEREQ